MPTLSCACASQKLRVHQWPAFRVKGKLRLETSLQSAVPSLSGFYARLRDDPPPYVRTTAAAGRSAAIEIM